MPYNIASAQYGYGYGGGGAYPSGGSNWIYEYTTYYGKFTEDVDISSPDGKVELHIE